MWKKSNILSEVDEVILSGIYLPGMHLLRIQLDGILFQLHVQKALKDCMNDNLNTG